MSWVETILKKIDSHDRELKKSFEDFMNSQITLDFPGESEVSRSSIDIAFVMALISLATELKIHDGHQITLTGEIAANGDVLAVGGIYAKLFAANASKIKINVVPMQNKRS